jgi:Ca2+-binding EF-hand superfamily protein
LPGINGQSFTKTKKGSNMMNSIGSSMASSWASKLFTQLDTKNQGYIEQSDLASALSKISDDSSSVDEIFSQLDGDSDGKVTQDEMTSALEQVAAELDKQFNNMRIQGGPGGPGDMPPPPPENDAGFTEEELASQLEEIGSTDSQRSELISKVLENFDTADTDDNGKVSFKEAMALDQSSNSASSSTTTATEIDTASASSTQSDVTKQIMQLLQAYQVFGRDEEQNGLYAALSISA